MWYECKIKYSRINENDRVETYNQPYLFDAMSFTEAEARVNEEMAQYISTEFKITNIKVSNLAEIVANENGDRWFKCKLSCITTDEEKGIEKRDNSYVLVQANDVKDAYNVLAASLTDTISNFEIPNVTESPILDVFPYYETESTSDSETKSETSGHAVDALSYSAEKAANNAAEQDEFLHEAAVLILEYDQVSASLLQRKLKLGYNRAGRIIDQLESHGIVGPFAGVKARGLLVSTIEEIEHLKK